MADTFKVTLSGSATYTDMSSGKTWRKYQSEMMEESAAARYKTNPAFTVAKVEQPAPKAKAKPAVEDGGGDEGGAEDKKTTTKKTPQKAKP